MSPIPIASVTRAPQPVLERRAGRLATAGLARDEDASTLESAQIDAAVGRRLDEVGGVRRRQHDRLRPELLDREQQPLGVPRPDRHVAEPDPLERGECRAGDERPGVVRRDDPLSGAIPDAA